MLVAAEAASLAPWWGTPAFTFAGVLLGGVVTQLAKIYIIKRSPQVRCPGTGSGSGHHPARVDSTSVPRCRGSRCNVVRIRFLALRGVVGQPLVSCLNRALSTGQTQWSAVNRGQHC